MNASFKPGGRRDPVRRTEERRPGGRAVADVDADAVQGTSWGRRALGQLGGGQGARLFVAWLGLGIALWNPMLPLAGSTQELLVVLDITQSMGVTDRILARPDGGARTVTRLEYAKTMLSQALHELPCRHRIGWAVFTAHRSFVLVAPMEVCANFQELQRTLAGIDFRMAWAGNSEVAKGLDSALGIAREMESKPAVVFVTDGHEAPPLNARYRPPFHGEKGDVPGLLVGVGGSGLSPIPKIDVKGRVLGAWRAKEVMQVDPRSADKDSGVTPMPMVGATPGKEHLSALRDDYLRVLADEVGLGYQSLDSVPGLLQALQRKELRQAAQASVSLRLPLCMLALLALTACYAPRRWYAYAGRRWTRSRDAERRGSGLAPKG